MTSSDSPKPPALPLVCPACGASDVKLATDAIYTVYLRCTACFNVWSMTKDEYVRLRAEEKKKDEGKK